MSTKVQKVQLENSGRFHVREPENLKLLKETIYQVKEVEKV